MLERYSMISNIGAIQDYLMDTAVDASMEDKQVKSIALSALAGAIDGFELVSLATGAGLITLAAYLKIKSKFE